MTRQIKKLKGRMYRKMPEIRGRQAVLITESYQQTEQLPTERKLWLLNAHNNIPITIQEITTFVVVRQSTRSCQVFPEFFNMNGRKQLDTINFVRQIHSIFQRKTRLYLERFFLIGKTRQTI